MPRLAPVQRKGHTEAGRVIAYTESLTVIPECEWVFIVRRKKGLFRSKKQDEVVVMKTDELGRRLQITSDRFSGKGQTCT